MGKQIILAVIGGNSGSEGEEVQDISNEFNVKYIVYFMKYICRYCDETSEEMVICRSGMESNIDILFAIAALKMRKHGFNVKLEVYIECENQLRNWNKYYTDLYNNAIAEADKVTYVNKSEHLNDKNVLMLGGCTRLLMFSSNLKEITERYVNYAEKEGIRTEIVNNI